MRESKCFHKHFLAWEILFLSPKKKTLKLGIPRFAYHKKTTFFPYKQTRGTHEKGRRRHEKREKKRVASPRFSLFICAKSSWVKREKCIFPPRERERKEETIFQGSPTQPILLFPTLLFSLIVAVGVMMRKRRGRGETTLAAGEKEGTWFGEYRIKNKYFFKILQAGAWGFYTNKNKIFVLLENVESESSPLRQARLLAPLEWRARRIYQRRRRKSF